MEFRVVKGESQVSLYVESCMHVECSRNFHEIKARRVWCNDFVVNECLIDPVRMDDTRFNWSKYAI